PPWRIVLLPRPDGRTVLLCRLHHAIADGMALMRVLLSISDEQAAEPEPSPPPRSGRLRRRLAAGAGALRHPVRTLRGGLGYGEVGARLLLRRPDPPSALRGPLGARKKTAWSQAVPLSVVKRIGRAEGATVNDVLVAAVAGALRRYLEPSSAPPVSVRAMVPVNLRSMTGPVELGNRFGLVMLSLPLSVADPRARLRETKRRMDQLKGEQEAVVAFVFLEALGQLDRRFEAPFVRFFSDKASLVLTNVPGPRSPLHLAGHAIRRLMFWVPQSGSLALGISILSYAGDVFIGVMTDEAVIAEPARIVEGFEAELRLLGDVVRGPGRGEA
ncbi:MAG: WS/DGAT domain-containing protein, partial [Nannocystaceae bacterium]